MNMNRIHRIAALLTLMGTLMGSVAFAQGVPIKSGGSGNLANVDSEGSLSVKITGTPTDAGVVSLYDSRGAQIRFADDGRMDTGRDVPMFRDNFVGSAIAAFSKWVQSLTTMTVSVATGALTLNASAITTANTYATLTTAQKFHPAMDGSLMFMARVRPNNLPQTNATAEVGLGNGTTNTAQLTDGAFFRWNASGGFECVIVRSSVETAVAMTPPSAGVYSVLMVEVNAQQAFCYIDRPDLGTRVEQRIPLDTGAPSAFGESPGGFLRVWTAASAPATAPQILVGEFEITNRVVDMQRPQAVANATMGHSAVNTPTTGLQAPNFTNSTGPVSATLSNTAAGYTTLGGKWQFAAVAGAATDYALFGYQVPTSYRFVVTGIDISTCNTVVAVATTPTIFEWGIGVNSTAVSLATTDATGATPAQSPRRIVLGEQSFIVGTAVGQCAPDLERDFSSSPLVVDSGRFLHVILAMPVGTATATEIFRGTVTVRGYFEY
jgi:hypothetical protein